MKVFVYGTLIPHALADGARVALLFNYARYYSGDFGGPEYPFIVSKKDSTVGGFVMEVDDIEAYDKIEQAGKLYDRKTVVVKFDDDTIETVQVYVAGPDLQEWVECSKSEVDFFKLRIADYLVLHFKLTTKGLLHRKKFSIRELRWLLL